MPNIGRWAIATCALALGGCSTLNGAPEPLFTVKQADAALDNYWPHKALVRISEKDVDKRNYRDRVVSLYLVALDARYEEFKRQLSLTRKGGSVAFDVLGLGLTGAASVWKDAATKLAAGATVIGGTKASLNKELYAEKTLPAILSLMDSNRLAVRADIMRGLKLDEDIYTLQAAFADLSRYENAASIDVAINQAAGAAADRAKKVGYDYSKAISLCSVEPALGQARLDLMADLEQVQQQAIDADEAKNAAVAVAARTKLHKAATHVVGGSAELTTDPAKTEEQVQQIADFILTICTQEGLEDFRSGLVRDGVLGK